mmetsp:Transcript_2334/g.9117  ORF Transcript_2334/g.9117 Transcript_2334/m.9117 type:complete len:264 (+) Transcript_2334:164-955(+)
MRPSQAAASRRPPPRRSQPSWLLYLTHGCRTPRWTMSRLTQRAQPPESRAPTSENAGLSAPTTTSSWPSPKPIWPRARPSSQRTKRRSSCWPGRRWKMPRQTCGAWDFSPSAVECGLSARRPPPLPPPSPRRRTGEALLVPIEIPVRCVRAVFVGRRVERRPAWIALQSRSDCHTKARHAIAHTQARPPHVSERHPHLTRRPRRPRPLLPPRPRRLRLQLPRLPPQQRAAPPPRAPAFAWLPPRPLRRHGTTRARGRGRPRRP